MGLQELGHVVLHVTDLEDSRRFQRGTLGWPELAGDLEARQRSPRFCRTTDYLRCAFI